MMRMRSVTAPAARSPDGRVWESRPTYTSSRTPMPPGANSATRPAAQATVAAPATANGW